MSVRAVGDGAQPMAGPVCRIWARGGGRGKPLPYGDGGRIAKAVGPSIARPLIRRLLRRGRHRRADPHIENSRPKDAGRLFCVLWCAGMRGNPFRQPPRGRSAAATVPPCGARKTLRAFADPCVFRPLRKKRAPFISHRQRERAFPPDGGGKSCGRFVNRPYGDGAMTRGDGGIPSVGGGRYTPLPPPPTGEASRAGERLRPSRRPGRAPSPPAARRSSAWTEDRQSGAG